MKTIKNLKAEEIRKSILQLAIQGKLVKQDPNDEPASELVKRIYAEKQRLIKEGKIKKDKNESFIFKGDDNCYYEKVGDGTPIKLENLPFEIPDNWTWVRHNSIFEIFGGSQPPKDKFISFPKEGYIRLYQIRDYGPNPEPVYIPIKDAHKTTKKDDILLARYGASVGKVFFAEPGAYNVAMAKVEKLYEGNHIDKLYLYLFYKSDLYQSLVLNNSRSAQAGFNKEDLNDLLIPIPSFKEQQRIVNRINDFNPLLNDYELAESKLTLLEQDFPEQLKKSILQYAIEGKLVKQDPNDEPASVLLERIKTEKEKLIKEGKIKRDKNESTIYQGDDKNYYEKVSTNVLKIDVPFTIPTSWYWSKIGNVCLIINGFTPLRSNQDYWNSKDCCWMTVDDINNQGKYLYNTAQHISSIAIKNSSRIVPKDSTFICCTSATIGKVAINKVPMVSNQQFNGLVIKDNKNISNEYIYLYCSTLKNKLLEIAGITTFPFVSTTKLAEILIPIPPYQSQIKIVKKVESIFELIS